MWYYKFVDDDDDDDDDDGGSLWHTLPIHEPIQKIENTTPTIIPITPVICMAYDDTKFLKNWNSFMCINNKQLNRILLLVF